MSEAQTYRVSGLIEALDEADADRLREAWVGSDPFAGLKGEGTLAYARGLSVATELRGFRSRRRFGAVHFRAGSEGEANRLATRLNDGALTAGTALEATRLSVLPVVGHAVIGSEEAGQPGLKAVYLVKRRDGMSPAEFHHYWLHGHGPLVVGQDGVTRYVQGHRAASSYDTVSSSYDGVTELSYPDEAAIVASGACQPHVDLQIADSPKLFDMNVGMRVLTREERIF